MNQPEPSQETPESESPPTGGPAHFPEPYFFLTEIHAFPDGSLIEDDEAGSYYRYPLRSWEAAAVLEWYEYHLLQLGDDCPSHVEGATDPETGLRSLTLTDKRTGEARYYYPRLAGVGRVCGLYTFSGHVANWATGEGRDLERLGEFVSVHAALGRPMSIFEAADEMDALCEALAADGIPHVRRPVLNRGGVIFHVERLEDANGEMMTARYSDYTSLVIGFAPVEKRISESMEKGS